VRSPIARALPWQVAIASPSSPRILSVNTSIAQDQTSAKIHTRGSGLVLESFERVARKTLDLMLPRIQVRGNKEYLANTAYAQECICHQCRHRSAEQVVDCRHHCV
jgi:hypothetical protein